MSMKFFSGLQDLIGGLYESTSGSGASSPSSAIPPTNGFSLPPNGRRKPLCAWDAEDTQLTKCSHARRVRFADHAGGNLVTGRSPAPRSPFVSLIESKVVKGADSPENDIPVAAEDSRLPTIAEVQAVEAAVDVVDDVVVINKEDVEKLYSENPSSVIDATVTSPLLDNIQDPGTYRGSGDAASSSGTFPRSSDDDTAGVSVCSGDNCDSSGISCSSANDQMSSGEVDTDTFISRSSKDQEYMEEICNDPKNDDHVEPPYRKISIEKPEESSVRLAPPPAEILDAYRDACLRCHVVPLAKIEQQIKNFHTYANQRQDILSAKGVQVSGAQMDCLEQIFKRAQFETIDFEYTFLEDDAAVYLSEMLEFYDSAHRLNLSFNRKIGQRGWNEIFKAVRKSHSLHMLNLRYTNIETSFTSLCKMVRAVPPSALSVLHLENIGISGKNLLLLVCALKNNTTIKELYLGENNLQPSDGAHLHQLITGNTGIQMLDLRNNKLGDGGLAHMCDALVHPECLSHSALSALVLWQNSIGPASMERLATALRENVRLETLNIGCNSLGVAGMRLLRPALSGPHLPHSAGAASAHGDSAGPGPAHSNLRRLGLQSTKQNCESAIILAESLAENSKVVRVDLRDNPAIGSAGLLALHSAMKINRSITLLNLDPTLAVPKSDKVRQYQDQFRCLYQEIGAFCDRNRSLSRVAVATPPPPTPPPECPCPQPAAGESSSSCGEKCVSTQETSINCVKPQTARVTPIKRVLRSSSLTCAETVHDIQDRIREMSQSTHALNIESNLESTTTIKKSASSTVLPHSVLTKAEWGSLPALHAACSVTADAVLTPPPTRQPPVRKTRRFSVSPSSSTFDVSQDLTPIKVRPSSLSVYVCPRVLPEEDSSASSNGNSSGCQLPKLSGSLPNSLNLWSQPTESEMAKPRDNGCNVGSSCARPTEPMSAMRFDLMLTNQQPLEVVYEDPEAQVKAVVADLVNYIVYEETSTMERKKSMLLGSLVAAEASSSEDPQTSAQEPITPSRMVNVVEALEESDEVAVSDTVRSLVREVLRLEKEALYSSLERKRARRNDGLVENILVEKKETDQENMMYLDGQEWEHLEY